MHGGRASQRGVAVLTAMLVVTIGTIIAVNLMWTSTLDQRRTLTALANDQGMMYALGAEAWAADILRQDLVETPDSDHLGELWAAEIPPLPIEGGFVVGRLEDLQGRFNVNNLVLATGEEDELMREQLERLLSLLDIDPQLAGPLIDWLDPDVEIRFPNGGEDEAYANADPQYRTPNTMITSTSELLAVAGFDPDSFARLAPYVSALPRGTSLNVNTASEVVLASLSDDIDIGLATSLVDERAGAEFVNIEASFQGLVSEEMLPRLGGISDHFLLTGSVQIGVTVLTIRSVLQRNNSGITRALFRNFGVE
jgi:general secretion pathway protein K